MRARLAALLLGLLLLYPLRAADAHPLHTTITDLTHEKGKVVAIIRIFADDFDAAVAGAGKDPADVRAKAAYLGRHFQLHGADGKKLPLVWSGSRLTDDLLWIRLEGPAPAGLRGGTVANTLAADLFADQVNIVKASYGERTRTLLFTRGTGPRRLD